MVSKFVILSAVIAYVEARFGQEQVPIAAISAVQGGDAGAAATIAGAAISDLLGGANSCAKLIRADQVFTELGGGADALAAAIGMVTAEKNTNPFANGNVQNVCGDASLPVTPELRGITPLIDPDVDVDGAVAALSQSSAASPLAADGLSVFDLLDQAGLGDLVVSQAANGGAAAGGAAQAGNQAAGGAANNQNQNQNQNNGNNNNGNDQQDDAPVACDAGNAGQDDNAAADNNNNNNAGADTGSLAGADFGLCTPTIIFEAGTNGRAADEFTFQIADPLARGGQSEALNPDIITNALCDQLTNVCEANAAAIAACEDAQAAVQGGPRDKSTADTFNSLLGFAGAVTNPNGGPEDVGATAARKMRRGLRA